MTVTSRRSVSTWFDTRTKGLPGYAEGTHEEIKDGILMATSWDPIRLYNVIRWWMCDAMSKDESGWTNVEIGYNALGVHARFEYAETHYCHSLAMASTLIGVRDFSKETWEKRHKALAEFPRYMEQRGLKGEVNLVTDSYNARYRYLFTVQSPR